MRIDRPEDTAANEVIEDRVHVVLFAMSKGKIKLAATVKGLGPGEREGIGIGVGVGTIHLVKTAKFRAVSRQEGMNFGTLMIGEITLIGPGKISDQAFCNGRAGVDDMDGEGLENRMLDEFAADDLPIIRPGSLRP